MRQSILRFAGYASNKAISETIFWDGSIALRTVRCSFTIMILWFSKHSARLFSYLIPASMSQAKNESLSNWCGRRNCSPGGVCRVQPFCELRNFWTEFGSRLLRSCRGKRGRHAHRCFWLFHSCSSPFWSYATSMLALCRSLRTDVWASSRWQASQWEANTQWSVLPSDPGPTQEFHSAVVTQKVQSPKRHTSLNVSCGFGWSNSKLCAQTVSQHMSLKAHPSVVCKAMFPPEREVGQV